jgi:hypothetical protein
VRAGDLEAPRPGPYRWPPFETTHGAYTPRVVNPIAEQLVAWARELAAEPSSPLAHLLGEHMGPSLFKWSRAEARFMRYEDDVLEHGEFDENGNDRPSYRALKDWEKRASYHAERCGFDPHSLARLRQLERELAVTATTAGALLNLRGRYDDEADGAG